MGVAVNVEQARYLYVRLVSETRMAATAHTKQKWLHRPLEHCRSCQALAQDVDAASIRLDLAVAEASIARTRASVAYA